MLIDLNARIAAVKGEPAGFCNYTGMLTGVAGLMRELNEDVYPDEWKWSYSRAGGSEPDNWPASYLMARIGPWGESKEYFESAPDRPGDCMGAAWLSVFEKENDA